MSELTALAVTTIFEPNAVMRSLASVATANGWRFHVAGDEKGPRAFDLAGCTLHSLDAQRKSGFSLGALAPVKSYARKNLAYLSAIREGASILIETDDDNYPRDGFDAPRSRQRNARAVDAPGWVNVYSYFTRERIWPRGLPLDAVLPEPPPFARSATFDCPIQQGLADANPDVDAIYRLILPLPLYFDKVEPVALGPGVWCPFNSQNTTWFRDAFPLLYLPSYCSFRMTDIWRSFVAQRIAWVYGWCLLFHSATVEQERNEHRLMRDFEDEISGYLNNRRMGEVLEALTLNSSRDAIFDNLATCYEALVAEGWVGKEELALIRAWTADCHQLGL